MNIPAMYPSNIYTYNCHYTIHMTFHLSCQSFSNTPSRCRHCCAWWSHAVTSWRIRTTVTTCSGRTPGLVRWGTTTSSLGLAAMWVNNAGMAVGQDSAILGKVRRSVDNRGGSRLVTVDSSRELRPTRRTFSMNRIGTDMITRCLEPLYTS